MQFTQLTTDAKYDALAQTIYSREQEYLQYQLICDNLTEILKTAQDGLKDTVQQQLVDNQTQMDLVEAYHAAALTQIDDPTAYAAAVARAVAARTV